jgi:predicted DNA-binding transcriptional regulator YafY
MPQYVTAHQYARRLQRLLAIINEIKTTPHQAPEILYTSLGISRSMFYKDRQVLKALGLAFHYNRQQRRHVITQDRYLPVLDLSTSELLALIMAVRQMASTGDYTLTYEAIAALRKVVSNTPAEVRAFLQASLDDVVVQDGLGCNPTILRDLWQACQERQRLRIVYDRGDGTREWVIAPYQLFFKRRALYLDACVVDTR